MIHTSRRSRQCASAASEASTARRVTTDATSLRRSPEVGERAARKGERRPRDGAVRSRSAALASPAVLAPVGDPAAPVGDRIAPTGDPIGDEPIGGEPVEGSAMVARGGVRQADGGERHAAGDEAKTTLGIDDDGGMALQPGSVKYACVSGTDRVIPWCDACTGGMSPPAPSSAQPRNGERLARMLRASRRRALGVASADRGVCPLSFRVLAGSRGALGGTPAPPCIPGASRLCLGLGAPHVCAGCGGALGR